MTEVTRGGCHDLSVTHSRRLCGFIARARCQSPPCGGCWAGGWGHRPENWRCTLPWGRSSCGCCTPATTCMQHAATPDGASLRPVLCCLDAWRHVAARCSAVLTSPWRPPNWRSSGGTWARKLPAGQGVQGRLWDGGGGQAGSARPVRIQSQTATGDEQTPVTSGYREMKQLRGPPTPDTEPPSLPAEPRPGTCQSSLSAFPCLYKPLEGRAVTGRDGAGACRRMVSERRRGAPK